MTCSLQQCTKCKFDFCWMCLGDWKAHGSEYYECSRYKENPNIANESVHAQAREALKKYLFYFERVCLAGLLGYMLLIHQRMRPVAEFCWSTSPTNIHNEWRIKVIYVCIHLLWIHLSYSLIQDSIFPCRNLFQINDTKNWRNKFLWFCSSLIRFHQFISIVNEFTN